MALHGDNHCPLCRAALWAPDTEPIGSRRCPRCGADLWVLVASAGPVFHLRQPGQSKTSFLAALFGMPPDEMEDILKGTDRLDMVEIVMEIEEGLRNGHESM